MAKSEKVYLYLTTPVDGSVRKFSLLNLSGEEQLSSLFHYQLSLSSTDTEVAMDDLLGKSATVTIEFYNAKKRYINGMVSRLIQADTDNLHTTYYIELSPWLWLLTQVNNCKIFQQKKVTDILADLFKDYSDLTFDDQTTATYAEKDYCVQYRESDFDFASRLMEEAGIFYFFKHVDGNHTLVLADDGSAHKPCPDFEQAEVRGNSLQTDNLVSQCSLQMLVTSNAWATTDYNFETPDVDLAAKSEAGGAPKLRIYDYPGLYQATADGEGISKVRMQAHEWPKKILTGESFCRAFCAGFTFTLAKHKRSDTNGDYVLSHLTINATQEGYTNTFEAFPKDTPFRPLQQTPRPYIHGSQTALVVGKSGEEIWTDEFGRIKVQFYWDELGKKDEKSSCWIRVTQIWAGKGWGTLFTPRMGAEVIVNFLEGDPDRPMVTGTVYNGSQSMPYALPDKKTTSTLLTRSSKDGEAGNELRFDDTKDSEELYMHAQKDMNVLIQNLRTETLNEGNDTLTIKKGDRAIEVTEGKETHTVKSTRELTVTDDETHTNKAKFTHKVTGDYALTIDGNLDIKVTGDITINGSKNIKLKAGMNIENDAGVTMKNKASAMMENKAGIIKLN